MITREEAERVAGLAATEWGATARAPDLVTIRENAVFRAELPGGRPIALRLHRPGYQSRAGIEAELDWTAGLAARGLPVPLPVRTRTGALTWSAGPQIVSAVGWLEGAPIGRAGATLPGDRAAQVALFHRIGRLLAALHAATDAMALSPALPRPRWDREGLLGENPTWGRFWENPAFGPGDRGLIAEARALAAAQLDRIGTGALAFGLIHADVMRENLLAGTDGRLNLIDFDDSGYGYRHYDLGTALVQSLEESNLPGMADALLEGYAGAAGDAGEPGDLRLFTLLRCLASAGWIATRAAPDDPRQALYAGRVRRLASHLLKDRPGWP